MNPLPGAAPHRTVPLSESPTAKMLRERRLADKEKYENAPRDVVPRADPPTQNAEVPPGIAPIRPIPSRKPGDAGNPKEVPMDTTGETSVPVDSPTLKPTDENANA